MASNGQASIITREVDCVADGRVDHRVDTLAVEEPLEIRVVAGDLDRAITVTMRTPGEDADLGTGLLISEGVIERADQIAAIRSCGQAGNVLRVELAPGVTPKFAAIERSLRATASCGLCGKSSLEAVAASIPDAAPIASRMRVPAAVLHRLPAQLRGAQAMFEHTGALHAVGAFSDTGESIAIREDIGRHNALDKLLGALSSRPNVEPSEIIVALSGRAGFELVQKAAVARVPLLVAIGAPSSLAVELAERAGITLIGFLREASFNVYCHAERVRFAAA
jgi:FdhD protein